MDMIESVARVLEPQAWAALGIGDTLAYSNRRTSSLRKARAAVAIVIEDCALVAESEAPGTPDGDWVAERIAHRIRSAPEDSLAHSELEKLAIPPTAGFNI